MIEISNSFTGNLQWDEERELPVTSKENTEGHGYGLSNIRMVARKYSGDIVAHWQSGSEYSVRKNPLLDSFPFASFACLPH